MKGLFRYGFDFYLAVNPSEVWWLELKDGLPVFLLTFDVFPSSIASVMSIPFLGSFNFVHICKIWIEFLLVVLSSIHFYSVDETIYFVNVLKEIPGKDSTDINTVCFMEFVSTGKYLKTTLKRPFFVTGISVWRNYKSTIKRLRKLCFWSNYVSGDISWSQPYL